MKLNQPKQAVAHAEDAACDYPSWSKPHCRRALALEALQRYNQAECAIYKAIDSVDCELAEDPGAGKVKMEYLNIQQRIQEHLSSSDDNRQGGMALDWEEDERKRRRALTYTLRGALIDEGMEQTWRDFCNQNLDDFDGALGRLLKAIFPAVERSENVCSCFETMLDDAPVPMRKKIEAFSMREGPAELQIYMQGCINYRVEADLTTVCDSESMEYTYREDIDGDAMRLISWDRKGKKMAVMLLHNLIVGKYHIEQAKVRKVGNKHPLLQQVQKLATIYNVYLPSGLWPCEEEIEIDWSHTADDIARFWEENDERVFRRWRAAIQVMLDWLVELLLLFQGVSFQSYFQGRLALNVNSVGAFLLKTGLEYGGATSLRNTLVHRRAYPDLIADCYAHLRLIREVCPKTAQITEMPVTCHNFY
jgi:hypothetical protein